MDPSRAKDRVAAAMTAVCETDDNAARAALDGLLAAEATVHLAHPFGSQTGAGPAFETGFAPLRAAFPDLDRREMIRMAGRDGQGALWVGCFGWYMGRFAAPFLGIPPTGRLAVMRYHEFFRVEGDRVTEIQSLWDIPELMMQAGVWPMVPSLGREWHAPAPATQDGLRISGDGGPAFGVVMAMLDGLKRNREGVEAMGLDRFWHPRMSWYGPAGIGSARGIAGFRHHHQAPFLAAMPDRRALLDRGHAFAEGAYVGFTAWPGMTLTLTGSGWLGLPATGARLTMRSLDFWRVEGALIRENWVLVDLLDVYDQLGVDVLARMADILPWDGRAP